MRSGRRSLLLGSAVLALAGEARAQTPDRREVVDAAERPVQVPVPPRSVFPAGPGAAVLVFAVAPSLLAGWPTQPSASMRALLPAGLINRPVVGRLTGSAPSADAERVRASGADLVLDMGTVNSTYSALATSIQAASGVPAVLLDGALSRTAALFRETGLLLGAEVRGEALAVLAEQLLADTALRVAGWPAPRLWYARDERGLGFAPSGAIGTEVPEMLGCRMPPIRPGARPVATPAELAAFDPEVAMVADARLAQAMRNDPAWQSTTAGRSGRILVMPVGPFGWADHPPSVQRLLGLRWLLSTLRPEALPAATMRSEAAGLLGTLFGISADDALISQLVGS